MTKQVAPILVPLLKFYFHEEVRKAAVSGVIFEHLSRLLYVFLGFKLSIFSSLFFYNGGLSNIIHRFYG